MKQEGEDDGPRELGRGGEAALARVEALRELLVARMHDLLAQAHRLAPGLCGRTVLACWVSGVVRALGDVRLQAQVQAPAQEQSVTGICTNTKAQTTPFNAEWHTHEFDDFLPLLQDLLSLRLPQVCDLPQDGLEARLPEAVVRREVTFMIQALPFNN